MTQSKIWPSVPLWPRQTWRNLPGIVRDRWNAQSNGEKTVAIVLCVYVALVSTVRFWGVLQPYVAETDWKQWVWQYWRYNIKGAFPAGNLITDYTFNAQPPVYHMMMATLSTLLKPTVAADVINWFSWTLALGACLAALRSRGASIVVCLMCAALFVRDDILHKISAGGYPRSFGPTLSLLFLAAWLSGRRRLVFAVMLFGAGVYPSVCVPMGLAFGAWHVLNLDRLSLRGYLQNIGELALCAVGVGVLAQLQSLTAPDWWGPVVWAKDAGPELTSAGRTAWLPLSPYWPGVWGYVSELWNFSGLVTQKTSYGVLLPWPESTAKSIGAVILVAICAAGLLVKPKGSRKPFVPPQLLFFFVGSLLAFLAARLLAFKLYLPHRMVQHTVPPFMFVFASCAGFTLAERLAPYAASRAKHLGLAAAFIVAPSFILAGDGVQGLAYRSYAHNKPIYQWLEKNTSVSDLMGGNYRILDEVPLFAARQVYVNWKMAHPFRKGFFEKIAERTVEMYDAIYAENADQVKAFSKKTGVRYLIVSKNSFEKLEYGDSQLFEPMYSQIKKTIFEPRFGKFLFAQPSPAMVFAHAEWMIIDIEKL
jgi:hypothetical protein